MADEENKGPQLSDEQMKTLAQMVAEQMVKSQSNHSDDSDDNKPPKKEDKENSGNQLTPDQIADAVMAKIQNNTNAENQKVYETLWNEKYNQTINSVNGLDDYINGEDDYGVVRAERLKGIESYEDRISALTKLTNSFKEASAGKPGRRPVVNKAAQKKAEEAKNNYDELQKKAESGEYTSVDQMTRDFWAAVAKETEGMT